MTASSDKPRDFVQEDRDDTLRILREKLERARKWVRDLESMVTLAQAQTPPTEQPTPVLKIKKPKKTGSQVAIDYLKDHGSPQPYVVVRKAILDSGVMTGKEKPEVQADKAIKFAVGVGLITRTTTDDSDMVGLVEGQPPA